MQGKWCYPDSGAIRAGVRTAGGLQTRFHPAFQYVLELIADGYIGDVQGTTLIGSGFGWVYQLTLQ